MIVTSFINSRKYSVNIYYVSDPVHCSRIYRWIKDEPCLWESAGTETYIHHQPTRLNQTAWGSTRYTELITATDAGRKYLERTAPGDTWTEVNMNSEWRKGRGWGDRKGQVGMTVRTFQAERIWKGLNTDWSTFVRNSADFYTNLIGFSSGHVWMWELDCEESWAPKNWCFWTVVLEKTLESPLDCKEIQPAHSKWDQSWVSIGRTDAEGETPVLWPPHVKRPWCWEGLGTGGEGDNRGWDGWMASPTQWTWVWVKSRSWCWTGRPGMLRFMGSQRVGHDWATELNWRIWG